MEDEKFKIGDYVFQTFHEYRDAQEDVKKIEAISQELDLQDTEVALRLYNMIREGKIVFRSPIGENFVSHVSDIMADRSEGLLEDKAVVDEAEGKVRNQKLFGMAVISLAVILFGYFGISELQDVLTARRLQKLADQTQTASLPSGQASAEQAVNTDPFAPKKKVKKKNLKVLSEYRELKKQNPDLVGWLRVPGADVDLPVVQKDNSYYLTHAFDGSVDTNGTLFVDQRSDIVNPTTNTIIYGHNMKSGLMFGSLKRYLDEDYFNANRTIQFDTIYEKRTYELVAVCLTEVEYQDDSNFRYYNFITAQNQSEWDVFVRNITQLEAFDSGVALRAGDEVLTLSTCNSYTEDGRLFLVAKRIN